MSLSRPPKEERHPLFGRVRVDYSGNAREGFYITVWRWSMLERRWRVATHGCGSSRSSAREDAGFIVD